MPRKLAMTRSGDLLSSHQLTRYRLKVEGRVQGVGFRPFVYRLASALGVSGWVLNDGGGVIIEAQGTESILQQLILRIEREAPPLSQIETIRCESIACCRNEKEFKVLQSISSPIKTGVIADAAICSACLEELFNPEDRRYRYPFINCSYCGPRYTIIEKLPYDRNRTVMKAFTLCQFCAEEYKNPLNRRFHAETIACPSCGPQLRFLNSEGNERPDTDAISHALRLIRSGGIIAIKGLGGFQLVCDASDAVAVKKLRKLKQRPEKPFAVMVANVVSLTRWVLYEEEDRELLEDVKRPILLLRKKREESSRFESVSPNLPWLGVMLPNTPLHYLLFHEALGRPKGRDWLERSQELVLVCTSANKKGMPILASNENAVQSLRGLVDGFVVHDRHIHMRCDDSVYRPGKARGLIRRARGYVLESIQLPLEGPSVLAVGASLKNTICLTRGNQAYVSQYLGDLDNAAICRFFNEMVEHLLRLLEIQPEIIVHDAHPDFYSSQFAVNFAVRNKQVLRCLSVQHHHAHVASVMAERRVIGPCLGVALDGMGLGTDGMLWGGELLYVSHDRCQRLSSLNSLAMPGGDRAVKEPWRMAASALHALGERQMIIQRFAPLGARIVLQLLDKKIHSPFTSSAGRLFDAAAGLLNVCLKTSYEGQAAMQLEALALEYGSVCPLNDGYQFLMDGRLSFLPLLAYLAKYSDAPRGAAIFHSTFSAGLIDWVSRFAFKLKITQIVLSGGCWTNEILRYQVASGLRRSGFDVLEARLMPTNDGGISLGQAYVALMKMQKKGEGVM